MPEQRKQMRRRTLLGGHITIDKLNGWSLDCTVRNLSLDGARIAIPEHVVVPELFSLAISGGESRKARLIWAKGGQAGVEILGQLAARSCAREDCRNEANSTPSETQDSSARLAIRIAAVTAKRPRGPYLVA